MKFTLIFLIGLCALGVQAMPTDLNAVEPEPMGGFLSSIVAEINRLSKQTAAMLELITDLIGKMVSNNVRRVSENWDEIITNLNKMNKPEAKQCINQNIPAIKAAYEVMQNDDQECTKLLSDQATIVESEINESVELLKQTVKDLSGVVVECASSDEKIKCIQDAKIKIKNIVDEFVLSSEDKLKIIYKNFMHAADKTAMCVLNSFLRFDKIFNAETQKMFDCVRAIPTAI